MNIFNDSIMALTILNGDRRNALWPVLKPIVKMIEVQSQVLYKLKPQVHLVFRWSPGHDNGIKAHIRAHHLAHETAKSQKAYPPGSGLQSSTLRLLGLHHAKIAAARESTAARKKLRKNLRNGKLPLAPSPKRPLTPTEILAYDSSTGVYPKTTQSGPIETCSAHAVPPTAALGTLQASSAVSPPQPAQELEPAESTAATNLRPPFLKFSRYRRVWLTAEHGGSSQEALVPDNTR